MIGRIRSPLVSILAAGAVLAAAACTPEAGSCPRCDTLVIAAVGEPDHLLPPFVWQSVGRDINDLIFERLAVLDPSRSPLDPAAYAPGLASRWERIDSLSWRFHLRPDARWHDGRPVTAADVVFAFEAHQDPAFDAVSRGSLEDLRLVAEDSATVRLEFKSPRPDQLYDATYHVRVFPKHIWDSVPRDRWGASADPTRLVGSGPYRLADWRRGQSLALESTTEPAPAIRRVVWRFAESPEAAGNLVLSGEADLLETLPDPARRPEFERAPELRLVAYPSAVYGFLGFNLAGNRAWGDPRVRRALALGLDRDALARAVFGAETVVPAGPLSAQLWLWERPPRATADSASAVALLDDAGWRLGRDGRRGRGGRSLAIDILVPTTSATRRSLAIAIQERWARLGVAATVTPVDFPVFQERLQRGRFQTFIGAWLDEPHPRSLADQWSRSGWDKLNYGRYANPVFDSLLLRAVTDADSASARRWWRAALDTLNADAPAIWLYAVRNVAVVHQRVAVTGFRAFSWLSELRRWSITAPRDSTGKD